MMTEEFNHYLVLADVLEFALGRPITDDDVGQMAEDRELNDMRRHFMESGDPCLVAALGLTEGGGSLSFGLLSELSGGELEDRLVTAMGIIYKDEKNHYENAARVAADKVGSLDDLERMKKVVTEVSLLRVKMRFEQSNEPMDWREVEKIIADNRVAAV